MQKENPSHKCSYLKFPFNSPLFAPFSEQGFKRKDNLHGIFIPKHFNLVNGLLGRTYM